MSSTIEPTSPIITAEKEMNETKEKNEAKTETKHPIKIDDPHVVYHVNAQLMRFDLSSGQWKERCQGHFYIYYYPTQSCFGIVMYQNKTLTLRLRQRLKNASILQRNADCTRSWAWCGADFSEYDKGRVSILGLCFKTETEANQFVNAWAWCRSIPTPCDKDIQNLPVDFSEIPDFTTLLKESSYSKEVIDGPANRLVEKCVTSLVDTDENDEKDAEDGCEICKFQMPF